MTNLDSIINLFISKINANEQTSNYIFDEDYVAVAELKRDFEGYIANQVREAYRKGYNDNARDCYCDSAKVIESLIPHKHLMDDGKSHDIRPDLPKGDDK